MDIPLPPAAPLPDAADHVLLLHGMGCSPSVWREVQAAMPVGTTCIAAPIAGHRGGEPLERGSGRTMSVQMIDDLERQLDALGIGRVHVVGNSLGGWLALRLSERGRALSAVCLAPAGGWRPGSMGERVLVSRFVLGHRAAVSLARRPQVLASAPVRRMVLAPVAHRPAMVSTDVAAAFVRDLADCQALRFAIGHPAARRLEPVRRLGSPTTIVWSEHDRVLSGAWARAGFSHLGATEYLLPAAGHVPMLDEPARVAALVVDAIRGDRAA